MEGRLIVILKVSGKRSHYSSLRSELVMLRDAPAWIGFSGMRKTMLMNQDRSFTRWISPKPSWIRLDIDGSVLPNEDASCGGLIRDDLGNWIKGFTKSLCYHPTTTAELLALTLVQKDHDPNHPLGDIIKKIRCLVMKDWAVTFNHAFRECNKCANWLARQVTRENSDTLFDDIPPPRCRRLMGLDLT
ncbi:uncharacterized protein LOC129305437 [Prosopis cineraria]|uniref:uncharacterized protein LOC129305437 n=1 Tax=Prosopis cineraria TaxID=364024 RepID=UPI00240F8217|nr:uncharacterized protein LOC129305437 [Prosopis cineraria]